MQCLDESVLEQLEEQWTLSSTDEMGYRMEALRQCMEKLHERSRSLLQLRYEEGLPCAHVAQKLRRSVNAVYQSLSRIHRDLRQCVERRLLSPGQAREDRSWGDD
jgi:RNA polymerase sigma-70 factor (ECF subfamily)